MAFSYGKPGHDNQTLGLAEALARQWPLEVHALPPPAWQALGYYLLHRSPVVFHEAERCARYIGRRWLV
jgi:hypothetical protein